MLPHLGIKPYPITDSFNIDPFWTLVLLSVLVGFFLARSRVKTLGLKLSLFDGSISWILCFGFIISHWVTVLFYFPQVFLENPWIMLDVFNGMSSFGGFIGGTFGAWAFFRFMKSPLLPYADAILFGFVFAWVIARLGCTITFDHPGLPSQFFLAMKDFQGVARHNLGFYEMLFTFSLAVFIFLTRKQRHFVGFHTSIIVSSFSLIRFLLDFLRIADKTYFGMTPGQYFALALFSLGLRIYWKNHNKNGELSPNTELAQDEAH